MLQAISDFLALEEEACHCTLTANIVLEKSSKEKAQEVYFFCVRTYRLCEGKRL